MNKKVIKSEILKEQYIKIKHKSGLQIILYPKEEHNSVCAMFGTKFGSIDNSFKTDKGDAYIKVPDGIAHYLEHKLFESEEKDAFYQFAQTGASANAYTSFDRTVYYFSTTANFYKSLKILMDFVTSPYFTDENVQKERGIIGQEIKMYDDDPSWRVMFNCLEAMYHNHPVNIDIAGDITSINEITKEKLYECYNAFYNMNNMVLVAVGNFDVLKFMQIVDDEIELKPKVEIERGIIDEKTEVVKKIKEIKLSVSQPQFCLGFKLAPKDGVKKVEADMRYEIINEMLLGEASWLYDYFYKTGLVAAGEVASEVFSGRGYYALLFEGESKDPIKVSEKLKQEILKFKQKDNIKEDFELAKKVVYGKMVRTFGTPDRLANSLFDSEIEGVDIYESIEIIANISENDIREGLQGIDVENSSLSIVNPA